MFEPYLISHPPENGYTDGNSNNLYIDLFPNISERETMLVFLV